MMNSLITHFAFVKPNLSQNNYLGEDCFAVLDEEYGRFISPNYPEPYPSDTGKNYLIRLKIDQSNFTSFLSI